MRLAAGHVRTKNSASALLKMPGQEIEEGTVQTVEVQDFGGGYDVDSVTETGIGARPGHIDVLDADEILKVVLQHIGFREEKGVLLDVAGRHVRKAEARSKDAQDAASAAEFKEGFPFGFTFFSEEYFEDEGAWPDLCPQGQIQQRVFDGVGSDEFIEVLGHVFDIQHLKLPAVYIEGFKIHPEAGPDAFEQLVESFFLRHVILLGLP